MALVLADRVKETTATAGTGTVTLLGASTGFQSFAVIGNSNTTFYCIAAQSGSEWEVGIGTYTSSGTTLARTTVLSNSAGTQPSALSFSAGTKDVFVTYPSSKSVYTTGTGSTANTANGVIYANSTGVVTTGSALTFDGTNFATTGSATATRFIPSGSTVATNGMYLPSADTLGFSTASTERMRIGSTGGVGIGSTSLTGYGLRIGKAITGATTSTGAVVQATIQSDVTTAAYLWSTYPSTQATAFTLPDLRHYDADQGTIGATSAVTNQYGFRANATLTGATNNYGFYGNIASGTGRWNFYAAGTAQNFFAGDVITNGKIGLGTAGSPSYGTSGQVLTSAGSGAAPTWAKVSSIILENAQTISSNYTITAGNNGLSAGPVTVNTGVTVTVGTGQTWVVV